MGDWVNDILKNTVRVITNGIEHSYDDAYELLQLAGLQDDVEGIILTGRGKKMEITLTNERAFGKALRFGFHSMRGGHFMAVPSASDEFITITVFNVPILDTGTTIDEIVESHGMKIFKKERLKQGSHGIKTGTLKIVAQKLPSYRPIATSVKAYDGRQVGFSHNGQERENEVSQGQRKDRRDPQVVVPSQHSATTGEWSTIVKGRRNKVLKSPYMYSEDTLDWRDEADLEPDKGFGAQVEENVMDGAQTDSGVTEVLQEEGVGTQVVENVTDGAQNDSAVAEELQEEGVGTQMIETVKDGALNDSGVAEVLQKEGVGTPTDAETQQESSVETDSDRLVIDEGQEEILPSRPRRHQKKKAVTSDEEGEKQSPKVSKHYESV